MVILLVSLTKSHAVLENRMSKIYRGLSQTIDLSTLLILTVSMTTKIILVPRKYVAYGTSHLRSNVKDIANILMVHH